MEEAGQSPAQTPKPHHPQEPAKFSITNRLLPNQADIPQSWLEVRFALKNSKTPIHKKDSTSQTTASPSGNHFVADSRIRARELMQMRFCVCTYQNKKSKVINCSADCKRHHFHRHQGYYLATHSASRRNSACSTCRGPSRLHLRILCAAQTEGRVP